jgi:hypothetical protein
MHVYRMSAGHALVIRGREGGVEVRWKSRKDAGAHGNSKSDARHMRFGRHYSAQRVESDRAREVGERAR